MVPDSGTPPVDTLLGWEIDRIAGCVRNIVNSKRGALAAERDKEEYFSLGMMLIVQYAPKYDPARASPSTFIFQVLQSKLISAYRHRIAMAKYEPRAAKQEVLYAESDYDPNKPLPEQIAAVYRAAKNTFTGRRYRQGRRFYNVAQMFAIAFLMQKRNLSSRGCHFLLEQNKDIRSALRLHRVPSHRSIRRARGMLRRFTMRRKITINRVLQSISETEVVPLN